MYKTDLEIAQEAKLLPIGEIAKKVGMDIKRKFLLKS